MRKAKRLSLEELAPYLWTAPEPRPLDPPALIDWRVLFKNDHPVEIEVGFGKGAFLVAAAPACPQVNFFGVEIVRKYQLFAATRVAKRGLANVRLACGDARTFLRDRVAPGSVQAIHVYFPDPWWKKRHHKRRVFTQEFVALCVRSIRPGGRFYLATDVPDYFAVMAELCSHESGFRLRSDAGPAHNLEYLTNFERKAREHGHLICRAVYERV